MILTREDIKKYVSDPEWQKFRVSLKGLSTDHKLKRLDWWLTIHNGSFASRVQVQNYKNALKRGGLL